LHPLTALEQHQEFQSAGEELIIVRRYTDGTLPSGGLVGVLRVQVSPVDYPPFRERKPMARNDYLGLGTFGPISATVRPIACGRPTGDVMTEADRDAPRYLRPAIRV